MAVAVGNVDAGSAANSDTLTISHTTPAGSNIVLMVMVGTPNSVSSVSWNSQSLTQIRQDINTGFGRSEIWYLTGAAASTTADITVSLNGGMAQNKAAGIDFTGGGTPTNANGANGDAATSSSVTVASAGADDFIVDAIYSVTDQTVGADQTERHGLTAGGTYLHTSTQDGVNGGVMSWTFSSSDYAHSAVRIPAAASPNVTINATVATATAAGVVPTVATTSNVTITATVATADAAGVAPVISISKTVTATVATADAAGVVPTISAGNTITATTATATAAGVVPTLSVQHDGGFGQVVVGGIADLRPDVAAAQSGLTAPPDEVGGTGVTIVAVVATATAAGVAPSISTGTTITSTVATATAAGIAPTVTVSEAIVATVATATAAGVAPSISTGNTITATAATATAAGIAPVVSISRTVTATTATASAAGLAPTITVSEAIVATVATATAAGVAPSISTGTTITAAVATATAAGIAPTISTAGDVDVTATVATATALGVAPTVSTGTTITATAATATAAGVAPTVSISRTVTAVAATATAAGINPTITTTSSTTVVPPDAQATAAGVAPSIVITNPDATIIAVVAAALAAGLVPEVSVAAPDVVRERGGGWGPARLIIPPQQRDQALDAFPVILEILIRIPSLSIMQSASSVTTLATAVRSEMGQGMAMRSEVQAAPAIASKWMVDNPIEEEELRLLGVLDSD